MTKIFITLLTSLFSFTLLASDLNTDQKVMQMILNNSNIMAEVNAKIKSILPKVKMSFSGIEVKTSPYAYSAIMTYKDTAKSTFWHPAFGICSVLVTGKIQYNALSVDSIREYDCGE